MEVKNITVLGAGTMGHGIAQAAITAGFNVVLYDVKQEFVDKGVARIRKSFGKRVEKGKLTQEQVDATMALLKTAMDLAGGGKGRGLRYRGRPGRPGTQEKDFCRARQNMQTRYDSGVQHLRPARDSHSPGRRSARTRS